MGKGKFDYRQLEQLKKQLEALEQEMDVFCQEMAEELAARLLRKVVKRTPVGEKPKILRDAPKTVSVKVRGSDGKARKRSFLSKEGAILEKYWSGYMGGTLRRGWTVEKLEKQGGTYRITVINQTSYASYVEFGHRQKPGRYIPALGVRAKKAWVLGQFMLTISEKEIQNMAPKLLKKRIEELIKEAMDVK